MFAFTHLDTGTRHLIKLVLIAEILEGQAGKNKELIEKIKNVLLHVQL